MITNKTLSKNIPSNSDRIHTQNQNVEETLDILLMLLQLTFFMVEIREVLLRQNITTNTHQQQSLVVYQVKTNKKTLSKTLLMR